MKKYVVAAAILGGFGVAGAALAKDIVATATDAGQFTVFLKASKAAGMDKALQNPGPFTVFAPTDAAFQALPPGELDRLMKPANKQELGMVLGYHVLVGRLTAPAVSQVVNDTTKGAAATIINQPLIFSSRGGKMMVNDAAIAQSVDADNGVIHVIDKVLLPAKPLQPAL